MAKTLTRNKKIRKLTFFNPENLHISKIHCNFAVSN